MSREYIICTCLTILIALVLPVTAAVIMAVKRVTGITVILVGAAVFILFQGVTRIPLLTIIQNAFPQLVPTSRASLHYVVYVFVLALSAGVFEEGGRFLAFSLVLKKFRRWRDGIGFGIGHGGIESILVAGLAGVTALFTYVLQPGQPDWYMAISGIERLFAMIMQVGLSLLVLYGVYLKKFRFVLLAVAVHMMADFVPLMLPKKLGVIGIESAVGLFAVASLVWIIKSRRLFKNTDNIVKEV